MLLISASLFDAEHVTRRKDVAVDVALNGTFSQIILPVTDNMSANSKRRESSHFARRHSTATSKPRRRRGNSRQRGMSVEFPFIEKQFFHRSAVLL